MANSEFDPESLEGLKYKTPFFLFSEKRIIDKYKEFKECFPEAIIHYAMKANSEPKVLKTLLSAGANFEVASRYELQMLDKIKVPAERIIYGTSVKSASGIKEFFNHGVNIFAFDSPAELEKIARVAPKSKVYVRVLVNDSGSVFRFSEKFGTEKENIVPLLKHAKEIGLVPYGISFHVGSQASNPKAWAEAIQSLSPIIADLKKEGIEIQIMDIGGGYPCNYVSAEKNLTLKEIAKNTLKEYKGLPYKPKLILEPGRGLVATTGVLVTTIIERLERKGNTWLFLDAGVYNALFEAMSYQGSTRYRVSSLRNSYDSGEMLYVLAGPTGDSPDIITHEALLPADLQVGDKLVFHDIGAYSLVNSSRFNGFPKPKVYFV